MALNADQRAYLENLSPRAMACKARRRHPFPILVPGEPWPAGVRARAVSGGVDIIYTCPNCGRERIEECGPNGVIGVSTGPPKYAGGDGGREDYLAPVGLGLKPHHYMDSYAAALAPMIRKAVKGR